MHQHHVQKEVEGVGGVGWGEGPERRVMTGERRTGTQGSNRAKILASMYSDRWSCGMVGKLDRRG
jgi:hypothetical protein